MPQAIPPEPELQTIVDGDGFRRRGWACTACDGTGRVHVEHMLPQDQRCDDCSGAGRFDVDDEE